MTILMNVVATAGLESRTDGKDISLFDCRVSFTTFYTIFHWQETCEVKYKVDGIVGILCHINTIIFVR